MTPILKRWADLHVTVLEQRIVLGAVLLIGSLLLVWDRVTISRLTQQLRAKEFILAPGVADFATVRPQLISPQYVRDFASGLARILGCYTARDIESQYREAEKFMNEAFRAEFVTKTKTTIKEIASEDVSELFSPRSIEVEEAKSEGKAGFHVVVRGRLVRFVSGIKVHEESHVLDMELDARLPNNSVPWALQVNSLRRLSEDTFLTEQKGKKS